MEPSMSVLACVSQDVRAAFEQKAVGLDLYFIENASQVRGLVRQGHVFSVAILPATLPEAGIWALWGQIRLLNPRPEILVYAPGADFQTWSGVLEAGGHDVVSEPFSSEELRCSIAKAEAAFHDRISQDQGDEVA